MENFFDSAFELFENPIREKFKLHTHEYYEIYIFLNGDTDYIVEGHTYNLKPYDIIILKPGEMHRAFHKSQKAYSRIVFNLYENFFKVNNCPEYLHALQDREPGKKNKIPSEIVKSSGISNVIERWQKYTDNGHLNDTAISKALFIEILYLINNTEVLYNEADSFSLISGIISYINTNFTRKITLKELEESFYVSRYHLCREFKKNTGYTIINYINSKRLNTVKELYKNGMSIGKACIEAGFSGYSAFYKAYSKEFNTIPKYGLNTTEY